VSFDCRRILRAALGSGTLAALVLPDDDANDDGIGL